MLPLDFVIIVKFPMAAKYNKASASSHKKLRIDFSTFWAILDRCHAISISKTNHPRSPSACRVISIFQAIPDRRQRLILGKGNETNETKWNDTMRSQPNDLPWIHPDLPRTPRPSPNPPLIYPQILTVKDQLATDVQSIHSVAILAQGS